MNEYKMLHETPIRAAIDLLDLVKNPDLFTDDFFTKAKRSPYASTSIARIASNMTLVFPVMCSSTLSIETGMMIMKAIERKCAVMLQILFSAYQVTDVRDAEEFINRFHSNIRMGKGTIDDFMRLADAIATESGSIVVDKNTLSKLSRDFVENCFFVLDEDIAPKSIGDKYNESAATGSRNRRGSDNNNSTIRDNKDVSEYFKNQILSSDIKKANELAPTAMVVNFKYLDSASGRATDIENIVIGVKARYIPVTSDDIINHILTKLNDKNFVVQLIRATTREISFFKDLIFAIDNAKIEALANSKRGSANPMWKLLERRALMSKLNQFVGIRGNNANAITTLVVSQEEIEYVRKNYGTDFNSIKNINTILSAYNLMGFVIADESLEIAKFLFDTGEDVFETLAFSTLEKEASDNSYKKIVNLMSKLA